MRELVKMAWRNLWRNKRRTLITVASVFFAVFFAYLMRAFQQGSYDRMVYNVVHSWSGSLQIHAAGYWEEKILNNAFLLKDSLVQQIGNDVRIAAHTPRIETFMLASYGEKTKGIVLQGIEPNGEATMISLQERLKQGQFITGNYNGAMLGSKLADFLGLKVGDTLVLLGMGYHGTTAAGTFPVKGILFFPIPELDGQMVFLSLPRAQGLLSAEGMATSLCLTLGNEDDAETVKTSLKTALAGRYEVMDWQDMMPELVQQIKADNAEGLIMLAILYMIIGFGVLGTVLMMVNERIREFGMMIAVGMQKTKLLAVFLTEMFFIGLLGIIAGLAFSLPGLYYYYLHPYRLTGEMGKSIEQLGWEPVMPAAWQASYFINQSLIVFIIFALVMVVPATVILRLKLIKALKH